MAATGEDPVRRLQAAERVETIAPDAALVQHYNELYRRYRSLYPALKGAFT